MAVHEFTKFAKLLDWTASNDFGRGPEPNAIWLGYKTCLIWFCVNCFGRESI